MKLRTYEEDVDYALEKPGLRAVTSSERDLGGGNSGNLVGNLAGNLEADLFRGLLSDERTAGGEEGVGGA